MFFFVYSDVDFALLTDFFTLRLGCIGPCVDTAEFVDVGVAQFRQGRGCRLAAVPTAAAHQNCGILFGDHLSGGILVDGSHRQQGRAGDVTSVTFALFPRLQDYDLRGQKRAAETIIQPLVKSMSTRASKPT